ncbi:MAG: hypothetical protein MZV63_56575 [Marinilabiliales bacterium]|nr:hypothetical protein [Marinilabiliales bacterium]
MEFANRSGMTIFDFLRSSARWRTAWRATPTRGSTSCRTCWTATTRSPRHAPGDRSWTTTTCRASCPWGARPTAGAGGAARDGRAAASRACTTATSSTCTTTASGGADPFNRPMMERWDVDGPLYRGIAALARVRRENPAVQRGYHQAALAVAGRATSVERGWGESVCLAAFTRGRGRARSARCAPALPRRRARLRARRTRRVTGARRPHRAPASWRGRRARCCRTRCPSRPATGDARDVPAQRLRHVARRAARRWSATRRSWASGTPRGRRACATSTRTSGRATWTSPAPAAARCAAAAPALRAGRRPAVRAGAAAPGLDPGRRRRAAHRPLGVLPAGRRAGASRTRLDRRRGTPLPKGRRTAARIRAAAGP